MSGMLEDNERVLTALQSMAAQAKQLSEATEQLGELLKRFQV